MLWCPAYNLEITGDGSVSFKGIYPTDAEHHTTISGTALEGLLEVFRKANYFSLAPEYAADVTCLPAYITSISCDGQTMSVRDYCGIYVGMPMSVCNVENAIDEAAGTSRWLPAD